jgi:hypothetical protein
MTDTATAKKDTAIASETITSAKELCKVHMLDNNPTFVEGPPGVGKSEMWRQIAEELKIGFMDLRLAQLDPVDLRGLPRHHEDKHGWMTTWSRPDFWPVAERDGERGILQHHSKCPRRWPTGLRGSTSRPMLSACMSTAPEKAGTTSYWAI